MSSTTAPPGIVFEPESGRVLTSAMANALFDQRYNRQREAKELSEAKRQAELLTARLDVLRSEARLTIVARERSHD